MKNKHLVYKKLQLPAEGCRVHGVQVHVTENKGGQEKQTNDEFW